ncbi:MAG: flavodoxin [Clostridia bacterium]|jgi:flavodoxin|nr:flavodoxin [Clostridia bacterium]
MENVLVVYYSHSSNTSKLAKMIAGKVGGKLYDIIPKSPYPNDYNAVVEQARKEIQAGFRPPLKTNIENIGIYDTVFVGTPNWCSSVAPPVATFLESNDLSGKTVIPFCTNGGGGFGHIEHDIQKLCSNSKILPGFSAYGSNIKDKEVSAWLKKIGIKEK